MIINMDLITGILTYVFIFSYFILKKKLGNSKIKHFFIFIFASYFIYLLKYAIFPIYISTDLKKFIGLEESLKNIIIKNTNFIPVFRGFYGRDFFLNIVMTFPLGVILPCLKKDLSRKDILKIGIFTGLGIELIQFILIFIQGFTFRNININDSIANFLGIVLGFEFFLLFLTYTKETKLRSFKLTKGIFDYLLRLNKKLVP